MLTHYQSTILLYPICFVNFYLRRSRFFLTETKQENRYNYASIIPTS